MSPATVYVPVDAHSAAGDRSVTTVPELEDNGVTLDAFRDVLLGHAGRAQLGARPRVEPAPSSGLVPACAFAGVVQCGVRDGQTPAQVGDLAGLGSLRRRVALELLVDRLHGPRSAASCEDEGSRAQ